MSATSSQGGPCIENFCLDPVVAVSGRRQELVFFGESAGAMRVHHLDSDTEEAVSFASGSIVDPVAATYRAEDDSYYVLVRAGRHKHSWAPVSLELLRVDPARRVTMVSSWPSFGLADQFGLTTGWQGTLVVSAWSEHVHLIAELDFEKGCEGSPEQPLRGPGRSPGEGSPRVARALVGAGALAIPALHEFRGVYRVRSKDGIADPVERISLEDFPFPLDFDHAHP